VVLQKQISSNPLEKLRCQFFFSFFVQAVPAFQSFPFFTSIFYRRLRIDFV
jgi:hypothetical protein